MTTPHLRAHLLRATHEWLTEQGHTPYVQVLVDSYAQVPAEYVRDGSIVLNMSYDSTNKLLIGDDWIEFQARFNGQVRNILFPTNHVVSLFSKETQEGYQGMSSEEYLAIREGRYRLPDEASDSDSHSDAHGDAHSAAEADTSTTAAAAPPSAGAGPDKAASPTESTKKTVFTRIK